MFRRNIYSSECASRIASTVLQFSFLWIETGVGYAADQPFHRTVNQPPGYILYATFYNALKVTAAQRDLNGKDVTPHSLWTGGADTNAKAQGNFAAKFHGNWKSRAYLRYMDLAQLDPDRVRQMLKTNTTNEEKVDGQNQNNERSESRSSSCG